MKRSLLMAFVLTVATSGAATAQAAFGPQLSWADDADLGIGARVEVPLAGMVTAEAGSPVQKMFIIGSFDWFFPDDGGFEGADVSYWEINGNLAYPFDVEGFLPYAGGGLNIAHASVSVEAGGISVEESDTDVGLNVLGGLKFPFATFDGFVEARFELGGGEQFVLSGGILLGR